MAHPTADEIDRMREEAWNPVRTLSIGALKDRIENFEAHEERVRAQMQRRHVSVCVRGTALQKQRALRLEEYGAESAPGKWSSLGAERYDALPVGEALSDRLEIYETSVTSIQEMAPTTPVVWTRPVHSVMEGGASAGSLPQSEGSGPSSRRSVPPSTSSSW